MIVGPFSLKYPVLSYTYVSFYIYSYTYSRLWLTLQSFQNRMRLFLVPGTPSCSAQISSPDLWRDTGFIFTWFMHLSSKPNCFWSNVIHKFFNVNKVESVLPCFLCTYANNCRTEILQIFKGEGKPAARGFTPMRTQPILQTKNLHRDSAQHNQKKISDIHGRYISKPLVWKKLLCTDLMYGLWDWAGILSVKVTGERILVFLKTFVPLVTASAVMSLKICLCDSFVILSGQRKEEPFSEIWLHHYTCQIPFSMQIKNGLLKSSSGLFSCYFLKYINPKQFKPLQTQAFSLTHKHRAKSCF